MRYFIIATCLAHLLVTVFPISQPQTRTVDEFKKVSGETLYKIGNELLTHKKDNLAFSRDNVQDNENQMGILMEKISGGRGAQERAAVSWSEPCAPSDGGAGSGTLEFIALDDCFSRINCSLVLNTYYNISFRYSAGVTERASLKLDITAMETTGENPPKQMIDSILMPTVAFTAPTKYSITRLISFPPEQFADQNKPYQLQLRLYSQNATSQNVVICQTVPISLTGIPGNTQGNAYNAPCTTLFKPCAFKNSMCLNTNSNGGTVGQVCQCNPEFSYYQAAGKNCGKIVGSYCGVSGSAECIDHAECKVLPSTISAYGECTCKAGFSSDATTPEICYDQTKQNNTNFNNVKVHGAACTYVNAPCAYNNSICLGSGTDDGPGSKLTCQCDSSSVYLEKSSITDEPGCKKILGTYCEKTVECIEHADCVMAMEGDKSGYCACSQGYTSSKEDLTKCSSGGRGGSPGFHSVFVIFPVFLHVIGLLTLLN